MARLKRAMTGFGTACDSHNTKALLFFVSSIFVLDIIPYCDYVFSQLVRKGGTMSTVYRNCRTIQQRLQDVADTAMPFGSRRRAPGVLRPSRGYPHSIHNRQPGLVRKCCRPWHCECKLLWQKSLRPHRVPRETRNGQSALPAVMAQSHDGLAAHVLWLPTRIRLALRHPFLFSLPFGKKPGRTFPSAFPLLQQVVSP